VRSHLDAIDWPAIPSARGAAVLAVLGQLERSEWWTPERLAAHQLAQARRLLRHACLTVPWYRERRALYERLTGADSGLADWRALPFLTRRDVQDAGERLWSAYLPAAHGPVSDQYTSGSTGQPIHVRGTNVTALMWHAVTLREHRWHARDLAGRLAVIRSTARGHAEPPDGAQLPDWGPPANEVYATGPCSVLHVSADIATQAHWLARQRADYLLAFPSNVAALIAEFAAHGARPPALKAVRTIGEMVPPELRGACREAWDAPLQDVYSSNEFGYIALQCPLGEHYHVNAETVLVEVLDAAGRPCAPGEIGRLVVTGLHNLAMPLVRYELGDYAEVGAACPCGRGLPVIARILGRTRNILRLPDGRQRWPSFPAKVWSSVAPVRQLQLVQERLDLVVARVVTGRELTEAEAGRLLDALRASLGYTGGMKVERVAAIAPGAGGKYEQFLSRL